MKLIWSPEALGDLVHVREYISTDNPKAGREVVSAMVGLIEHQLPRFPNSGRQGRVAGTLELVIPNLPFIVPYRINADAIEIIRVYHASRRWPDKF